MIGKAQSVNPFLTVMFLKMSLKTWVNYVKTKKRKIKKHLRRRSTFIGNKNSMEITDEDKAFEAELENQEDNLVYIYQYQEEIVYVTSDSEDENNNDSSEFSYDLSDSFSDNRLKSPDSQKPENPLSKLRNSKERKYVK